MKREKAHKDFINTYYGDSERDGCAVVFMYGMILVSIIIAGGVIFMLWNYLN